MKSIEIRRTRFIGNRPAVLAALISGLSFVGVGSSLAAVTSISLVPPSTSPGCGPVTLQGGDECQQSCESPGPTVTLTDSLCPGDSYTAPYISSSCQDGDFTGTWQTTVDVAVGVNVITATDDCDDSGDQTISVTSLGNGPAFISSIKHTDCGTAASDGVGCLFGAVANQEFKCMQGMWIQESVTGGQNGCNIPGIQQNGSPIQVPNNDYTIPDQI